MARKKANGDRFPVAGKEAVSIRIPAREKMIMERVKERADAVPLATDAPQGFVAQALPRASARALVPRPRSGRLGVLMKEKSRTRRSSEPIEIQQENSAMNGQEEELIRLRASVNCATVLERLGAGWALDLTESTRRALKFRRGPGEILIVNHDGKGWFDPLSEAKGDIFSLVQHLEPALNFGQVRRRLRAVAGVAFAYPEQIAAPAREVNAVPAERWAERPPLRRGSAVWRYLTKTRCLPEDILRAADAADVVREGPYGSAWFAHRDHGGALTGIEMRGPEFRGFTADGAKALFRFGAGLGPFSRLAIFEAPIDALSMAAFEKLRTDTIYVATTGGMGPGTVLALKQLFAELSNQPNPIVAIATDNDAPGERHAKRLTALIEEANLAWERAKPPGNAKDWNKFLQIRAGKGDDE
ncbi:MAG: DUF3991 and TOPRIM domain-containing protein [Bradyrhizobium sp.]|nr:DUF3991 and TOPRIM domain-containing protein [Bradyrhizobium sp.]